MDVSVAHSGEWVIAGAIRDSRIGVDVERIEDVARATLTTYISDDELADIAACNSRHRDKQSAALWCLKEAEGKLLGVGITEGLRERSFPLREAVQSRRWQWQIRGRSHVAQMDSEQRYILAVCWEGPLGPVPIDLVPWELVLRDL